MAENGDQKPEVKEEGKLDDKSTNYIKELIKEKNSMDPAHHSHAMRLIDEEIKTIQSKGMYNRDTTLFMDVFKDKPVRIATKVIVPTKEHPKFNFMGQLLGPKGSSLKRLQDDTMTKMAILGKGSMKDKAKEDEYRNSLDPKYSHLNDELHVEVAAYAGPAEAYARLAYALAELKKYLTPEILTNEQRGMGGGPMRNSRMHGPPRPLLPHPGGPGKSKVLSILDRARQALNPEPYPEDPYYDAPLADPYNGQDYYDSYPPPPPPPDIKKEIDNEKENEEELLDTENELEPLDVAQLCETGLESEETDVLILPETLQENDTDGDSALGTRTSVWNDNIARIKLLIKLRTEKEELFSVPGSKKHVLWSQIGQELSEILGIEITGTEADNKWRNLIATYRRNVQRMQQFPGYSPTWEFFYIFHECYKDKVATPSVVKTEPIVPDVPKAELVEPPIINVSPSSVSTVEVKREPSEKNLVQTPINPGIMPITHTVVTSINHPVKAPIDHPVLTPINHPVQTPINHPVLMPSVPRPSLPVTTLVWVVTNNQTDKATRPLETTKPSEEATKSLDSLNSLPDQSKSNESSSNPGLNSKRKVQFSSNQINKKLKRKTNSATVLKAMHKWRIQSQKSEVKFRNRLLKMERRKANALDKLANAILAKV